MQSQNQDYLDRDSERADRESERLARECEKRENSAIRVFIGISFTIHLLCLVVNPLDWFKRPITAPEWEMEADLGDFAMSEPSKAPAPPETKAETKAVAAKAEEDKETSPPPELLPQLPTKFKLTEKEEDEEAVPEAKPKPPKVEPKPEPVKELPEKAEAKLALKSDKDAQDLEQYRKELLERLKKEQQRQLTQNDKQKAKQDQTKKQIQALLSQRLEKVSANQGGSPGGSRGSLDNSHPYVAIIRRKIKENFSLPDIYSIDKGQIPVLSLQIANNGDVQKLSIDQSSSNDALDKLAMKSVFDSAPFPSPPSELWGQVIQIKFDPTVM